MKYRVIGQNRDTGARMVLEFQAESKGAAERKAAQQGMTVTRVEDVTDGHPPKAHDPVAGPRRSRSASSGLWRLIGFGVAIIAVLVALYWFVPAFRGLVYSLTR